MAIDQSKTKMQKQFEEKYQKYCEMYEEVAEDVRRSQEIYAALLKLDIDPTYLKKIRRSTRSLTTHCDSFYRLLQEGKKLLHSDDNIN